MSQRLTSHLRRALRNVKGEAVGVALSTGTIALIFFIFSTFLLGVKNLEGMLKFWSKKIQIICYLESGLSEGEIKRIEKRLLGIGGIEEIRYVSSAEAKEMLVRDLGDLMRGMERLEDKLFPATLELGLGGDASYEEIEAIARKIERIKGIAEVQHGGVWLKKLTLFLKVMKAAALVFGAVLAGITISITATTVHLTFYHRLEEVEIMRLIGATEDFIRFPFYLEGGLQGLSGAGLSLIVLFLTYWVFSQNWGPQIRFYFGGVRFEFLSPLAVLIVLTLGFFSGFMGGVISLARSRV